jgi:hypothetical protein
MNNIMTQGLTELREIKQAMCDLQMSANSVDFLPVNTLRQRVVLLVCKINSVVMLNNDAALPPVQITHETFQKITAKPRFAVIDGNRA